jgi:pilus assembly protein Flp/PilA
VPTIDLFSHVRQHPIGVNHMFRLENFIVFFKREEGASLAEYGLLLVLIAVICVAAMSVLGSRISGVFTVLSSSL